MIRTFLPVIALTVPTLMFGGPAAQASVPFELPPELVAGSLSQPRASAIGDIDGDGNLDIVTVEQAGGRVVWYENRLNEGQGWQAWTIDSAIENPSNVVLGDLTGNGYLDVAVSAINTTAGGTSVAWYRNDGNPHTNNGWDQQITATGLLFTMAVGIGDINGNGRNDIISAAARGQNGPFELVWFENVLFEGATTILDVNARVIADDLPGISSLEVGDITRNGQLEVAVSVSFNAPGNIQRLIGYYEHGGNPAAGPWTQVAIDSNFQGAWRVSLADLTGNGALDVVGTSFGESVIKPFFNTNGNGSLWTPGTNLTIDSPVSLRTVDLNQNGSIDFVVGTQAATGGDRVVWYENNGAGGFSQHDIHSVGSEAQFHVTAGDIRGDGDPDIVVTSALGNTVSLIENATIHRNAVFNKPVTPVAANFGEGGDALAADLNRDGLPDVVAASPQQGAVRWWANDNDGAGWTASTITSSIAGVTSLAVGDFSRNGFLEVAAASPDTGLVEVYLAQNNAATSWNSAVVRNNYPRVSNLAVADVEGNGRVDIIAASPDASVGDIVWFENQTGTGTDWAFPQVILANQAGTPAPGVERRIAVGDVTGNALPDVVSGLTEVEGLTWHRNDDGGSFSAQVVEAQFALADRPILADVDRDGTLDIIAVGSMDGGPSQLAWFRNVNGDGSNWQREAITAGSGPFALLAVADFNQDGFVDILARTPGPVLYANDGNGGFQAQPQPQLDLTGRVAVADFDRSGDLDTAGLRAGTGGANGLDLGWFENAGGQFSFHTVDTAPAALGEESKAALLGITGRHLGRAGDSDIQITSLALRFETESGDPYSTGDLTGLLSSVEVYLDNGDGEFDAAADTLVATVSSFDLEDGVETIGFADDDPDMRMAFGDAPVYWVVATAQPDGSTALAEPRFRVVHLTENTSTAIDGESDLPLAMAFTPNAASGVVQVFDPDATPLIVLLGANPLFWEAGEGPFVDPGAEVNDPNESGPISIGADNPGVVDANTLGEYTLVYNYSNLGQDAPTETRTVIVEDTTPPVITLLGDAEITIEEGEPFTDPGATAADSFEGDLTADIAVSGSVDIHTPGTYTLRYNVSDSSGNAAEEVTRTVVVEDGFDPRDINRDGAINAVDVQLVINAALGLDIGDFNADVNNDDRINAVDVQLVINGALGLPMK